LIQKIYKKKLESLDFCKSNRQEKENKE